MHFLFDFSLKSYYTTPLHEIIPTEVKMKTANGDMMYRINCLASDLDSLYHQAAFRLGLSDSEMFVLYLLHENGGECALSRMHRETSISKQTLNSAIRKLERGGIIFLAQSGGRTKTVYLTESGAEFVDRTVARLFSAELSAFNGWAEDEIEQYLYLMEKFNNDFRAQIEKM